MTDFNEDQNEYLERLEKAEVSKWKAKLKKEGKNCFEQFKVGDIIVDLMAEDYNGQKTFYEFKARRSNLNLIQIKNQRENVLKQYPEAHYELIIVNPIQKRNDIKIKGFEKILEERIKYYELERIRLNIPTFENFIGLTSCIIDGINIDAVNHDDSFILYGVGTFKIKQKLEDEDFSGLQLSDNIYFKFKIQVDEFDFPPFGRFRRLLSKHSHWEIDIDYDQFKSF